MKWRREGGMGEGERWREMEGQQNKERKVGGGGEGLVEGGKGKQRRSGKRWKRGERWRRRRQAADWR